MAKLTAAMIAPYAYAAGFRGGGLHKAVAVALAESDGVTNARGVNTDGRKTTDRGLWQINNYWHREVTDAQADNPLAAAKATFRISSGGADWSQWSTWKNGEANKRMNEAKQGVAQFMLTRGRQGYKLPSDDTGGGEDKDQPDDKLDTPGDAPGASGGLIGAVGQLTEYVTTAYKWLGDAHNWARIAMALGGGVAVIVGLVLLAGSAGGGNLASTAANVVPIGRVANIARKA